MFNLFQPKEAEKYDDILIHDEMTLEEAHRAMLKLCADEHTNHHLMGRVYNIIVDKKLAEAAGYKNAQEYASKFLPDISQSTLSMYGAVAREFSEPTARHFGVTCLYLLLTYAEAADLEVSPEEPGGTLIEVPGQKGEVESKPFAKCSVRELRLAIQRKRKPASSKPVPAEDRALAERYMTAVAQHMPRKGTSLRVKVRNHKGKTVLDFSGVPLTEMRTLIQALLAQLPPEPEVAEGEKASQ